MSEQVIAEQINAFFSQRGKKIPEPDFDILDSQLVDSMELIELLLHLEQELNVSIDQADITVDNFRTVTTILDTISRNRA